MSDSTVEYPFTDEGLRDALLALGGTGDVVAETLRRLGKRGGRRECHSCPVANYLWELWPLLVLVDVSVGEHDTVRVDRLRVEIDESGYTIRHTERISAAEPPGVAEFIAEYDDNSYNHYPFLEA